MIVLEGVTRTFGGVRAVDGVSLDVGHGEVVGLLGHNGAGKTTTVRLLSGLLAADAGTVRVDGLDPVADGVAVRRRLGVLPAEPPIDGRLSGRANLRFAAELFDVPAAETDERVTVALTAFGLAERADERAGGYSTGMRQRLALARVLLSQPAVLLLDEPTAALDPIAARQVRDLIGSLSRDERRTVVLCTHDLVEAQQLCDRVAVLEHGRVVAFGSPAELARDLATGTVEVEVHPADVDVARHVPSVNGVTVEVAAADRLHWHGLGRDAIPALVAGLAGAGVQVYAVTPHEPTLEDVYLALHEQGAA